MPQPLGCIPLVTRSRGGGLATGRCGGHAQASRQAKHCAHKGILMFLSCDKAFQDPCHSETREQKYVQQHIRICTHGVKTGLGSVHHGTIDTQSQLVSQSQVRPSQWLAGAGAQTQPMPCSVRTLKLPIGEGVPLSHRRVPGNQGAPRPPDSGSSCSLNGRSQLLSEPEIRPRHYPPGVGS